jgi:hypothetical protein
VAALRALFRLFSILFHGVLTLFLIGISLVALASGGQDLHLGMLPWTGATLTHYVLYGSLLGLLSIILALVTRVRFLFFIWALVIAYFAVKGYVFSSYHLAPGELRTAAYMIAGAVLALPGAFSQMFRRSGRDKRY